MKELEFKRIADHYPFWIQTIESDAKGHVHRVKLKISTPLCTDQYPSFRGSEVPEPLDGEVVCNDAPENSVIPEPVVAGTQVDFIKYRFYQDKLYEIEMVFPSAGFAVLSKAFMDKYGPSTQSKPISYENGFGAQWTGEELTWKDNPYVMILSEGSGNGPGQSSAAAHPSVMIMSDTRVTALQDNPKSAVDF